MQGFWGRKVSVYVCVCVYLGELWLITLSIVTHLAVNKRHNSEKEHVCDKYSVC